MIRKTAFTGAAAAALAAMALVPVAPVAAKGGDATIVRGTCSNGATWKLKGKPDSGVLEIEFEVDTNVAGRSWNVVITDNGQTVFSGSRTTLAPSGSFSVERRIPNLSGSDRIVATATRNSNTCRGTLTL